MKILIPACMILSVLLLLSCKDQGSKHKVDIKNEVLVLGMIHGGHLTEKEYGIEVLTELIRGIDPDVILTEIPPDRFPVAVREYRDTDSIAEPRVRRFPEYIEVLFPLSKEMDFEMIPTAGWTKEMADTRSAQLSAISSDTSRRDDWDRFTQASARSDSLITASGREFDPYWINTDQYDSLAEIQLSVYNDLFNEELGPGGWDNINQAHYGHIANALDTLSYQGKRILITYGAGHKGWFLRALSRRDDITMVELSDLVPPHR